MEESLNKSYEITDKEETITWEEVYIKIPKLLTLLKKILLQKIENRTISITTLDFFKGIDDFGIDPEEPYIMGENDFDNENFYKYVLKVSLYYLKKKDNNTINILEPSILKNLIDLCTITQKILIDKDNYKRNDVKYYIYHLINAFSEEKDKLENDHKFLKCGNELLLNNYKIKDFVEYYSENDKSKMRQKFYCSIQNLLFSSQQYMMKEKNFSLENETNREYLDKITNLISEVKAMIIDDKEIKFLENTKYILDEFAEFARSLNSETNFQKITSFIFNLKDEIPNDINDFYYSVFVLKI